MENSLILHLSLRRRVHFALGRPGWADAHSNYATPLPNCGGVEREVRVVYIFACTGCEVISVAATPS